jgi:DNA-3-methyladenine glycosylase II
VTEIKFDLSTHAPYRLDFTARVIKRRPENLLDHWDGEQYRRIFTLDDPARPVFVTVRQVGDVDEPRLSIVAEADAFVDGDVDGLTRLLRRALALDLDLGGFYALAESDPKLAELAAPYRGLRPPRFPSLLEAIVCAIACQQVTLSFGMTLVWRLCARYGGHVDHNDTPFVILPSADVIAALDPNELKSMSFSMAKARAIVDAAGEIVSGTLRESELESMDNESAIERLCRMRGVGRWTAEYILLRGLGRIDCFPGGDAGGRNNLAHWLGVNEKFDYDTVKRILAPWSEYEGLLFFLLMLRRRDVEA